MNEINKKIKQGYDSAELPEELRLRVREKFLAEAEKRSETESSITMSKKMKRPVAAAIIAAAALTVSITAAAAVSSILHKESIDDRLGEGTADTLMSTTYLQSVSAENEYLRITASAVFCDGSSAMVFLTKELLAEPDSPWKQREELPWSENISIDVAYADDGTAVCDVGVSHGYVNMNGEWVDTSQGNIVYDVVELTPIEAGRPVVLKITDFFGDPDAEIVRGLSLTINTTQNFSPITFANDEGIELHLTPYHLYTYEIDPNSFSYGSDFTLINSKTGARKTLKMGDGAGYGNYFGLNYREFIPEIEQYDTIEIENLGTFHKK